jgi:hypothetical protein
MKIVFVSHCNFTGNSAMHVFSIANELVNLGAEVVVCVPETVPRRFTHMVCRNFFLFPMSRHGPAGLLSRVATALISFMPGRRESAFVDSRKSSLAGTDVLIWYIWRITKRYFFKTT